MIEVILGIIALFFILTSLKVVNEWEEGIVLTLGRFTRKAKPGLNVVVPIIQTLIKMDKRITTLDIPKQEVMTKDNVPVMINAVVYMRIENVEKAVLRVNSVYYAVAQYAQTALRDVVGEIELDELLANREEVAERIRRIVDEETEEWGVDITAIKLQDIELPDNMKRAMAKQAEAEREKRAAVIRSEGELMAAKNLVEAAKKLAEVPTAVHLRTLHTISEVGEKEGNKVVYVLPLEVLEAFSSCKRRSK